ncbi:MAG TPA: S8 family serine peptidase [Nitrosopumilaceae archaeon]|nr:S8 family serine peptidase [Nitrosopumilaceae archaeon]
MNRKTKLAAILFLFFIAISFITNGVSAISNEKNAHLKLQKSEKYQSFSKKIDSRILDIFHSSDPVSMAKSFGIPFDKNKTAVYIYLQPDFKNKIPPEIEITGQYQNILVSKMSLDKINQIASLGMITKITPPDLVRSYGHAESQGVSYTSADIMHQRGFTGNGVKVAVIDSGFDVTDPEIASNVVFSSLIDSAGICGGDITCGQPPGFSHGTAAAENLVDMAPGVNLLLYAIGDSVDFNDAVTDATNRGAKIITTSIGFPTLGSDSETDQYRDGTSIVAKKVNEAKNNGILFTAAAGNSGDKHWMGSYNPSLAVLPEDLGLSNDYQSVMEFRPEAVGIQRACLPVTNNGDFFIVAWNDWLETTNDYDLFYYDSNLTEISGVSGADQTGGDPPFESLSSPMSGGGCLVLVSYSSAQDNLIQIDVGNNTLDESVRVRSNSLSTPADAAGALTVGAINQETDVLEDFSSSGPTDDGRLKPEICGPDNVLTHQNETSGLNPFFGTSPASAHVAGAAALLLEQNSTLSVDELRQKLIHDARFNPSYSLDNLCGSDSGALRLIPPPAPVTFTAKRTGLDSIELTFSENIDTDTMNGQGYTISTGTVTANTDPAGTSNIMILTTTGIVGTSETPTVTYGRTEGTTVGDASIEVTDGFNTIASDGVSPTFTAQRTSPTTWVITFSEDVDAANANENTAWTVSGSNVVTEVTDASNTNTLTITASSATGTEGGQTITYFAASGTIADSSANEITDGTSALASDGVPPTFTAKRTGLDTITLAFSENIDPATTDGSGFSLTGGIVTGNSDPAGSSNIMILTTSGIAGTLATPTVTYDSFTGETFDSSSNEVSDGFNTIAIDGVSPTFTAQRTGINTIVLTFSENVDTDTMNGQGYTISTGTVTANTDPAGTSNVMTLTTSGITGTSATPSVTYGQAIGTTIDTAKNEIANGASAVSADGVPPTFTAIRTSSTTWVLTFSENVDASAADEDSAWTISDSHNVIAVTDPANTNTLTITASSATGTEGGQTITYFAASGTVADLSGNEIANGTSTVTMIYCSPPTSGDWLITSNCIINGNVIAPGNVHIQNGAEVIITNNGSLDIDFKTKFLKVHSGSGVLIKHGGKIF